MKSFYFLVYLVVLFSGCHKENNSVYPTGFPMFSIYLLKDHDLRINDVLNTDINSLELESVPWLAPSDVDFYDYSSHCIYLTKDKTELTVGKTKVNMGGQPFVVYANSKRCYIGIFHSMALSSAPVKPFISEFDIDNYPKDVIHISKGWDDIDKNDLRINADVERDLYRAGKLHKGLSLSIGDISVISNQDTAVVRYSYTITNNDKENLYVIDPDKMGVNLFHYYTSGLSFQSNGNYYFPEYKEMQMPNPYNSWKKEWFTKIESGKIMKKTIIVKGYRPIPNGTYTCTFTFDGPQNIEKADRYLPDGRLWIGNLQAKSVVTLD